MLKILITSDIHLGCKDSPVPHNMRILSFKKLCKIARVHDIFLIAGDLTDCFDSDILGIINSEFKTILDSGTAILYSPGNSEYINNEYPLSISGINTTYTFLNQDSLSVYQITKSGETVFIYGLPCYNSADINQAKKTDKPGFHAGLFHADFNKKPSGNFFTISPEHIRNLALDFYALGYNHHFKLFKSDSKIIGAYPGSIEASSFNETGERYILSMSIDSGKLQQISRLTINTCCVYTGDFDCTTIDSFKPVEEFIEKLKSPGNILRLTLSGKRRFRLNMKYIESACREFCEFHFSDTSAADINILSEEYMHEDSLRGDFFRILNKKIKDGQLPQNLDTEILSDFLSEINKSGFSGMEDKFCF